MKLFRTFNRLTALLTAVLMIGCESPESNSMPGGDGSAEQRSQSAPGGAAERAPADASTERAPPDSGAPAAAGSEAAAERGESSGGEVAMQAGTILFVGTSLTAGQGVPLEQSFPLLIERRIDDANLPFQVVNAGVSGETSAGALARADWLLRQPFDVLVLETGANDMLRGIDPEATRRNIQAFIDRVSEARPSATIVLAGMLALPNLGAEYSREFEAIYPRLAEQNDLPFVPFLLDGVGGERSLNQDDGVHPNAEGHRLIAETVWGVLEPVLEERLSSADASAGRREDPSVGRFEDRFDRRFERSGDGFRAAARRAKPSALAAVRIGNAARSARG